VLHNSARAAASFSDCQRKYRAQGERIEHSARCARRNAKNLPEDTPTSIHAMVVGMKRQRPNLRMLRRKEGKRPHTKVGLRVFIFFVAAALLLGGIAISMNLRLEDWQNRHALAPRSR
jgi:hypothetical protein